jgi:thioredoxin reductase (NADPH)
MACALWLKNYSLSPIIIERENALGGMARLSPYPNDGLLGRRGESAEQNAEAFARHIAQAGIETWLAARPRQLQRESDGRFTLAVESSGARTAQVVSSQAVVIATGTRFAGEEWLDTIENARRMATDGRLHVGAPWALEPGPRRGSRVAVVGGGDNAFDVARMLAEKNVRVAIVMRSQRPRAMPLMVRRLQPFERSGMATVLAGREVRALKYPQHTAQGGQAGLATGERRVGAIRLRLDDGSELDADHVLLLLGYRPNSEEAFLAGLALARDERGFLVVDGNGETSCAGVFAIGDVSNPAHPSIATAIAGGTVAAREIAKRLSDE